VLRLNLAGGGPADGEVSVIARLFVYGTLMPGEARWHLLAPLTAPAEPEHAEATGYLYRTPYGWPAAVFDPAASPAVPGLVVTLRDPGRAFPVLDEIEGTDAGLFHRRLIATTAGQCWAYHWSRRTSDFQAITRWPGP
jgi:gamma-glutamylcyclotransferase (GGCT)/AIG2-like uncharacterized protein YtfP